VATPSFLSSRSASCHSRPSRPLLCWPTWARIANFVLPDSQMSQPRQCYLRVLAGQRSGADRGDR
jgi:hypothetical protein